MAKVFKRRTAPAPYILRRDRDLPPEQRSTFTLKPLSLMERAEAQDNLLRTVVFPDRTRELVDRTRQVMMELAVSHLTGVDNFPAGAPQLWPGPESPAARRRFLEQLDDADVGELGDEVWRMSNTPESEA